MGQLTFIKSGVEVKTVSFMNNNSTDRDRVNAGLASGLKFSEWDFVVLRDGRGELYNAGGYVIANGQSVGSYFHLDKSTLLPVKEIKY